MISYRSKLIRCVSYKTLIKVRSTNVQLRSVSLICSPFSNFKTATKTLYKMSKFLPLFIEGEVVKGFGRGSKQLGCPTANFSLEVVQSLPKDLEPGVYYGWAQVDSQSVHKMVANVGWCPFYQNKEMSVETHVLHKFERDFYGSNLKICVIGYLRPEKNFASLNDLIEAIKQDIENAKKKLDEEESMTLKSHNFFDKVNSV